MNGLEKIADTLIPSGGPISTGALEEGVPGEIERLMHGADPVARWMVKGAVWTMDLSAFFSPGGRRLLSLDPEAAARHLENMGGRTGLPGDLFQLLRHLIEGTYTSRDRVRASLGVGPAPVSDLPPASPPLPTLSTAQTSQRHNLDCDVCIVGTGAGGAPAAAVLARAGLKVLLLEEGGSYNRENFRGAPLARMARHYRGAGLLTTLGRPVITVVEARAVGGTTVFNSGSCFRPSNSVVKEWSQHCSLSSFTPDRLEPYFERAERTLKVSTPAWDILGGNARVMQKGAMALGLADHGIIPRPAPGCRGSDECVIGCPRDAKQSMALNYLPQALAHGAQLVSHCQVTRVRRETSRRQGWVVEARITHGATVAPPVGLRVRAKYVVIAAGALHTPTLLSGKGTRRSEAHSGRHLKIHPSFEVAGEMPEEVRGWEGVLQSYFIRPQVPKTLLEATFQPRGILSTAGLVPSFGSAYKNYLPTLSHWAIMGGMISEDCEGRLITEALGRPWVHYSLGKADTERIRDAMATCARVLFSAGAKRVFLPVGAGKPLETASEVATFEREELKPDGLHLFAFHPLGTARMAGEESLGVLDERGLVWGEEGLAVSDASMLPGSPQVNPMVSIIALAERNAESWVKEWTAR